MNNLDILLFDEQLSEEELIIKKSARDYCQSELMPRILDANRNEIFDKAIYKDMGSLGFLGAPIQGYGCAGTNYVSYGLIAREIESVDSSYRSAFSVQTSLAMHAIYKFGSDEQKEFYLPEMAKGNLIGCFGLTESEAGSDPAAMKTNAVEKENGYELNGSKTWITNSPIADVLIIWAKDEQGVLRGFIVDRDSKGLSTPLIKGKFALRASVTGQIFLDNVLGLEFATLKEILEILHRTYCSTIGIEFMHISDPEEKSWLQQRIEGKDKEITFTELGKEFILKKLIEAEGFEKYLHKKFVGTKDLD